MKTEEEWDARARELWRSSGGPIETALQLGREMAAEARSDQMERDGQRFAVELARAITTGADARAEEIIAKLHAEVPHGVVAPHSWESAMWHAMAIARSTIRSGGAAVASGDRITKPKEPETFTVKLKNVGNLFSVLELDEAAIRADEREKIAKMLDEEACRYEAELVRGKKPKTREQVLEEALIRLRGSATACSCGAYEQNRMHDKWCGVDIARRALEWKPE